MQLDELEWEHVGSDTPQWRRAVIGTKPIRTIWDNGDGTYCLHYYGSPESVTWVNLEAIEAQAVLNYLLKE